MVMRPRAATGRLAAELLRRLRPRQARGAVFGQQLHALFQRWFDKSLHGRVDEEGHRATNDRSVWSNREMSNCPRVLQQCCPHKISPPVSRSPHRSPCRDALIAADLDLVRLRRLARRRADPPCQQPGIVARRRPLGVRLERRHLGRSRGRRRRPATHPTSRPRPATQVFARRQTDRLHQRSRRRCPGVCHAGRGRRADAVDVSHGRLFAHRLAARRQAPAPECDPRSRLAARRAVLHRLGHGPVARRDLVRRLRRERLDLPRGSTPTVHSRRAGLVAQGLSRFGGESDLGVSGRQEAVRPALGFRSRLDLAILESRRLRLLLRRWPHG